MDLNALNSGNSEGIFPNYYLFSWSFTFYRTPHTKAFNIAVCKNDSSSPFQICGSPFFFKQYWHNFVSNLNTITFIVPNYSCVLYANLIKYQLVDESFRQYGALWLITWSLYVRFPLVGWMQERRKSILNILHEKQLCAHIFFVFYCLFDILFVP